MKKNMVPAALLLGILLVLGALPSAAPAQTSTAGPVTWKFCTNIPSVGFIADQYRWWSSELEKRTGGKIKVEFFWSGSLFKWENSLPGIRDQIAAVGDLPITYFPADFPIAMTLNNPYNGTDHWPTMAATMEMYATDPGIQAEYKKAGVKPITSYSAGFMQILSKTKITNLQELKGKRIRTYGGARVKWLSALGMNPISMNMADVFEALQRGVIDCAETPYTLIDSFKQYDAAKNIYLTKGGTVVGAGLHIGQKLFDSLPPETQKIVMQLGPDYNAQYAQEMMKYEERIVKNLTETKGVAMVEPSAADLKVLKETADRTNLEFVTEQEKKSGSPVTQSWNKFKDMLKKYETEVATKGYPWKR